MDMMSRIAALTAECLTNTWPEAQGLPTADEIRGLADNSTQTANNIQSISTMVTDAV